jgi:transcriptional regulator with XRE-family HTH domain
MAKQRTERQNRVARNLVFFRKEFGLSQAKIAAAVGVPANTWSSWEQAIRAPGTEMMFRIAEVLDRTVDELAAEKPEPSALPFPPAVALIVVDDAADPDALKNAVAYVRDLNRKHRQRRSKQRRAVDLETLEAENAEMEGQAPARSAGHGKATPVGKKR